MLNLGNRLGCSSYTDCALGRLETMSPGDRRVYCRADTLDYRQIVAALRQGHTVATNGGPLFACAALAGRHAGQAVTPRDGNGWSLRVTCHSLLPLRTIEVYCGGQPIKAFDVSGRAGQVELQDNLDPVRRVADWYVVRAENQRGDWAITSPIYVEGPPDEPVQASALLLEISNHTRFVELRSDFFAHLLVTVRPPEGLRQVRLRRDGQVVGEFEPTGGDRWHDQQVPVTGISGEYKPGWTWHRQEGTTCHLQADWPVSESGWYHVEATTTADRVLTSDQVHFDAQAQFSHALSAAQLEGPGTRLALWGYGEEMPLSQITFPFQGDHWWYPQQTFWRLRARFHGQQREIKGGSNDGATEKFRPSD